jgi:hypothetical protein
MEVLYRRYAGLDLGKDGLVACVRIHGQPVQSTVRTFGMTTRELLALSTWLTEYGVTHVAMEATGSTMVSSDAKRDGGQPRLDASSPSSAPLSANEPSRNATLIKVEEGVSRWPDESIWWKGSCSPRTVVVAADSDSGDGFARSLVSRRATRITRA